MPRNTQPQCGKQKILATGTLSAQQRSYSLPFLLPPHVCAYMKSQLCQPKSPADQPQSSAHLARDCLSHVVEKSGIT